MDAVISAISGGLSMLGPWGPLVGALVVIGYQVVKVRFPATLAALPHLVPLPAASQPVAPVPAAPDVPAPLLPAVIPPASTHPILDAILGKVFGENAPAVGAVAPAFLSDLHAELTALVKPK